MRTVVKLRIQIMFLDSRKSLVSFHRHKITSNHLADQIWEINVILHYKMLVN